MTLQDLGNVGEFVAAIATIITLVYLAVQIRQNTKSVRMTAEMGVSQQIATWASRVTEDPEIGRIYDKAAEAPHDLTEDERRRLLWFVSELFMLLEGQYQIYKEGHIAEDSWNAKVNVMVGLLENAVIAEWWEGRVAPFGPKFFEHIESRRWAGTGTWKLGSIGKGAASAT